MYKQVFVPIAVQGTLTTTIDFSEGAATTMATTDTAKPTTTRRKPAAKPKAAPAAAKRATRTTAKPAASSSTKPATRVEQAQQLAERAVLIPLGAALEARERVSGFVATTRSRSAIERQLARFEHRGGRARKQLERDARRTRARVERETRQARHGLERRTKTIGSNVEVISDRAQTAVQNGVKAGIKLVNGAQDRIAKVA